MKKKVLYIIMIILVALLSFVIYIFNIQEDKVIKLLKKNQNSSITIIEDNEIFLMKNENDKLNIASLSKWFIALEFANQVEKGILNPEKTVMISDLDKFNFENINDEGYESWIKSINVPNNNKNSKVTLEDIVQGMMNYSANANTEYLIQLLGTDNINSNITENLEMTDQEDVFYFVSSLLIPEYLVNKEGIQRDEVLSKMKQMSVDDYNDLSQKIFNLLLKEKDALNYETDLHNRETNLIWENRLSKGTSLELALLLDQIFYKQINGSPYLVELLNQSKNEDSKLLYKSGDTKHTSSYSMVYDSNDKKIITIVIFNDLNWLEKIIVDVNLIPFIQKIIDDENYIEKVKYKLD